MSTIRACPGHCDVTPLEADEIVLPRDSRLKNRLFRIGLRRSPTRLDGILGTFRSLE